MAREYVTVSSLQNLCIYELSKHLLRFKFELEYLPTKLKDIFLKLAGHRSNLLEDVDLLKCLIHPYVEDITFADCIVGDDMLDAIGMCKKIKKLQMRKYKGVTSEGFTRLFPKIPELEYLIVRNNGLFNDNVIEILTDSCPRIHTLDLSDCSNISDISMAKLSNLSLIALTVSGSNISDKGITNLLSGKCVETISELNVTRCPVTDLSFMMVIEKCKKISIFTLKDTKFTGDIAVPNATNLKQLTWTVAF